MSLKSFIEAYIECALWSSSDTTEEGGEDINLDDHDGSLTDEARATMESDCKSFYDAHIADNEAYADAGGSDSQAGHDFWLTRNGHGAGFWDRGLGKVGDELTTASKAYGSAYLYIGDNGNIYHG